MAARSHVGFRLPAALVKALDEVAKMQGVPRTQVVERWLTDRAVAEGWMAVEKDEAQ